MAEETPRRRTNLHDPRQREWEEKEPEPSHASFTGFQIVVCVLCILTAVGVRIAGGGTYTAVKAAVSQALTERDAGRQLKDVFHAMKAYVPDMKDVFASAASGVSQAASGSSSSASSAAAGQNSSGSAASQASSGASSQASSPASSSASSAASSTVASSHTAASGAAVTQPAGGAV